MSHLPLPFPRESINSPTAFFPLLQVYPWRAEQAGDVPSRGHGAAEACIRGRIRGTQIQGDDPLGGHRGRFFSPPFSLSLHHLLHHRQGQNVQHFQRPFLQGGGGICGLDGFHYRGSCRLRQGAAPRKGGGEASLGRGLRDARVLESWRHGARLRRPHDVHVSIGSRGSDHHGESPITTSLSLSLSCAPLLSLSDQSRLFFFLILLRLVPAPASPHSGGSSSRGRSWVRPPPPTSSSAAGAGMRTSFTKMSWSP